MQISAPHRRLPESVSGSEAQPLTSWTQLSRDGTSQMNLTWRSPGGDILRRKLRLWLLPSARLEHASPAQSLPGSAKIRQSGKAFEEALLQLRREGQIKKETVWSGPEGEQGKGPEAEETGVLEAQTKTSEHKVRKGWGQRVGRAGGGAPAHQ